MRDKSTAEQSAANRQVELISNALERAKTNEGYWLNVAGRFSPSFYPKGISVSPFNALTLGLHSEENGYKSAFYKPSVKPRIRELLYWPSKRVRHLSGITGKIM